jgi:hypothetical protein
MQTRRGFGGRVNAYPNPSVFINRLLSHRGTQSEYSSEKAFH